METQFLHKCYGGNLTCYQVKDEPIYLESSFFKYEPDVKIIVHECPFCEYKDE